MPFNPTGNPYGYGYGYGSYPQTGIGAYLSQFQNRNYYSAVQPVVFNPEFVGKPVEEYKNLLSSLSERNKSIADTVDTLDIALSNVDVMKQDASILQQAKESLRASVDNITNAEDYSLANGLLRKAYRDFAGNQGLNKSQQTKQQFDQYVNTILSQVGTKGFTQEMANNAIKITEDSYSGQQFNPEIGGGIWTGRLNQYQPAEYVDIGKLLDQFGSGYKEDAYKSMGAQLDVEGKYGEPGQWVVSEGSGWRQVTPEEISKHMRMYIMQEPAVLEYLGDRFELTSYNKEFNSEEERQAAKKQFVNDVLDNYIGAYTGKFAFREDMNEQSLMSNPAWLAMFKEGYNNPQQSGAFVLDPSVSMNKEFTNLIEGLEKKTRTYNEPISYSSQYATGVSSGFRSPSVTKKENVYKQLNEQEFKILDNVAKNYLDMQPDGPSSNPGGYSDQQIEEIRNFLSSYNADTEFNSPIDLNDATKNVYQAQLFGNDSNKEPIRNVTVDGQLPGSYNYIWFFDPETKKTYHGSSKEFKKDIVSDLSKGEDLQVLGKYNSNNIFPLVTGKSEFYDSYSVKIGDKVLVATNAFDQNTPKTILRGAIQSSRFTPETGGVTVNLSNLNLPIKGKVYQQTSGELPFRFDVDQSNLPGNPPKRTLKAETPEQLIEVIATYYRNQTK